MSNPDPLYRCTKWQHVHTYFGRIVTCIGFFYIIRCYNNIAPSDNVGFQEIRSGNVRFVLSVMISPSTRKSSSSQFSSLLPLTYKSPVIKYPTYLQKKLRRIINIAVDNSIDMSSASQKNVLIRKSRKVKHWKRTFRTGQPNGYGS